MEQGGISIIPATTMPDSSMGKSTSVGINLRHSTSISSVKEKLKTSWLRNLMKDDTSGWDTLICCVAEAIGTAILVFVGCTGCIAGLGVTPPVVQISLTFGFAVMIAIQSMGHISGAHINPCITIAAFILGKKSLPMLVFYITAQIAGALMGYALLKLITPSDLIYSTTPEETTSFCVTLINDQLSIFQAFMSEFIATAILVLFACGLWDTRNTKNTDSASVRFGLCVAVMCFIFIPYTGCSMNPARSISPALWNGNWRDHWLYWVAPISGSITAATIYRFLFDCRPVPNDSGPSINT